MLRLPSVLLALAAACAPPAGPAEPVGATASTGGDDDARAAREPVFSACRPPPPAPIDDLVELADVCDGPVCEGDLTRVRDCRIIRGDIILSSPRLAHASFPNLRELHGKLIVHAPRLTSLDLPRLTLVTESVGLASAELSDLDGLSALEEVYGDVGISDTRHIASLAGLASLRRAGGIELFGNRALEDLRGLERITELRGSRSPGLHVEDNPALVSLHGIERLVRTQAIVLADDPALADISALSSVVDTGDVLSVTGCPKLTSLAPLASIRSEAEAPAGLLEIRDDDGLVTLDGLNGFVGLSSGLDISGNDGLTSIAALSSLRVVGGIVGLRDNPALSGCQVQELVARLRASGFDGVLEEGGNLDGGPCP